MIILLAGPLVSPPNPNRSHDSTPTTNTYSTRSPPRCRHQLVFLARLTITRPLRNFSPNRKPTRQLTSPRRCPRARQMQHPPTHSPQQQAQGRVTGRRRGAPRTTRTGGWTSTGRSTIMRIRTWTTTTTILRRRHPSLPPEEAARDTLLRRRYPQSLQRPLLTNPTETLRSRPAARAPRLHRYNLLSSGIPASPQAIAAPPPPHTRLHPPPAKANWERTSLIRIRTNGVPGEVTLPTRMLLLSGIMKVPLLRESSSPRP